MFSGQRVMYRRKYHARKYSHLNHLMDTRVYITDNTGSKSRNTE